MYFALLLCLRSLTKDEFTLQLQYNVARNETSVKHPHLVKLRMIPASDVNDLRHWSLEVPIDLTKYISGGNALLGVFGLSALARIQSTESDRSKLLSTSEVSIYLFSLSWKSVDPTFYASAASYTAAKFPDTCKALDSEVVKICTLLSLQVHFKLPSVYQIVYDGEMISCFKKLFTYLMKVSKLNPFLQYLYVGL